MNKILSFNLYCESKSEFYTDTSFLPEDGYDVWTEKEIYDISDWLYRNVKGYRTVIPSGRVSLISVLNSGFVVSSGYQMNIYKQKDEWWIVTGWFDWLKEKQYKWKCDQWDGLIELLSDLLVDKKIYVLQNLGLPENDYYFQISRDEYLKRHKSAKVHLSKQHIKLFEGFNENKLYRGISSHESIDYLFKGKVVDFNKSHKIQIDESLGKDWVCRMGFRKSFDYNDSIYLADKIKRDDAKGWQWVDIKKINIYELEDEYYLLYYNHTEYDCGFSKSKCDILDVISGDRDNIIFEVTELEDESYYWLCDGLDGLIQCIETKKNDYWDR